MPDTLNAHVQSSELSAPIELIMLDATDQGGPILRFAPQPIASYLTGTVVLTPVVWNGDEYPPIPFETEDWAWDGQGSFPTPKVRVANVNGYFTAANIEFNNLAGVMLTRFRTFAKFLDGMPDADPDQQFPPEIYRIERKSSQTNTLVEYELSTDIDHQGAVLPARIVLKNACTRKYRVWTSSGFDYSQATCPYDGGSYFDANGVATDPPHDKCSKRLTSGCLLRFGNDPLPTYAFPGAGVSTQGA